jgi:hypothetical protein
MRSIRLVLPVADPHVLVEDAVAPLISISETPGIPIVTWATVDVAIDVPGASLVVTLGHNASAVTTMVLMLAVQPVVVLLAWAIRTGPVSGVAGTVTLSSSRFTEADKPNARPV